jgi:hypothetical protein
MNLLFQNYKKAMTRLLNFKIHDKFIDQMPEAGLSEIS